MNHPLLPKLLILAFIVSSISHSTHGDDAHRGKPNRLVTESSPYLLLHAHNPVDWYPWGAEALERARKENKPIFLSVGYSSCYWCHVMERKVFTNQRIADYLNANFINIKVDREERPDVDDIYMTSLLVYQQLSGSGGGGGWPLSMFLTPTGDPIAGATYLPPEDSPDGRTGFLTAATRIRELWTEREDDLKSAATVISEQVQRMGQPAVNLSETELTAELVNATVVAIRESYDPMWGGVDFNPNRPNGPRFPSVPRLALLLDAYERTNDAELLDMVTHTLTRMAYGGIRDHLAGGFHRYSTDRSWHVPHFEKMLYDQALLLEVYARTAILTGDDLFGTVAAEIADFVQREMTIPEGGFCSALDAETNAIEGEYYVWEKQTIKDVLGEEDAQVFNQVYGLNRENPFEHGFVLHLPVSLSDAASTLKLSEQQLNQRLAAMRSRLLAERFKRERPLLDDKVLTAWNALMIKALAISGRLLDRPQDIKAAVTAADFVWANLQTTDEGLQRSWRQGKSLYQAYLDDHATLAAAFLELHTATQDDRWLDQAVTLTEYQISHFYDDSLSAFFYTADNHEKLIARTSTVYDSVFPSANSVSVRNLLRLARLKSQPVYQEMAVAVLNRFAHVLEKTPSSCSGLASALNDWIQRSSPGETSQSLLKPDAKGGEFVFAVLPQQADVRLQSPGESLSAETPHEHSTFRLITPKAPPKGGFDRRDSKPLTVRIYPMYNKLVRGGQCLIAVELNVKNGWHVNAHPANPDFLVPTTVSLVSKQKVKATRVKYPKHSLLKIEGLDDPYYVYGGKQMVYVLVEVDALEKSDQAELEFKVAFQACNEKECLPPDHIIMKGKLPLVNEGAKLRRMFEDKFPRPEDNEGKPQGEDVPSEPTRTP